MLAGSFNVHAAIFPKIYRRTQENELQTIADIASAYATEFSDLRRRYAERALLNPLGLTSSVFLGNIAANSYLSMLAYDIQNYSLEAQALVTGIDEAGAHIYVIDELGQESCCNMTGFAAIGVGHAHATSQLMLSNYTSSWAGNYPPPLAAGLHL